MYTLYANWSRPEDADIEEFETHYETVHAPLAAAVPNMRQFMTTRTPDGLAGGEPAFYRVAEMSFASKEDLEEAEESEEWGQVRADAGGMIERFGVTMSVALGESTRHDLEGQS